MKLAVVFLLVFVAMSYQQQYQKKFFWAPVNHQQDQPSRFQHYQYPSVEGINDQDIEPSMVISSSDFYQPWVDQHYYQRRKTQYPNNEASPNISPFFWYMDPSMMSRQGLLFRNYLNAFNSYAFEDDEEPIKSRRRYPSTTTPVDPAQERLFGLLSGSFGGSPIVSNTSSARPLFGALFTKTFVSVTTLLFNITTTPLCIINSGINTAPCKRRRRGMKIPLDFYVPDDVASQISPSSTEKNEMTAELLSDDIAFYKKKNEKLNQFLLESSREDVVMVGSDNNEEENLGNREKRQFVASTTTILTSYSISTVTAPSKQISFSPSAPVGTSLICLPPGLRVC